MPRPLVILILLVLSLGSFTLVHGRDTDPVTDNSNRESKEQLLQQSSVNASGFYKWRHSLPGASEKHKAIRMRTEGIAQLEQVMRESKPGSTEWAKLKFRRIVFAIDDLEVVRVADVPDTYLQTIPVEVAKFRKTQIDAYLRMKKIKEASKIAEKCVSWASDTALLKQIRASGFDRGRFLRHIQDAGVIAILYVPQSEWSDETKLETIDRIATRNSSPQIAWAKSAAENAVKNSHTCYDKTKGH